jgi:hypothetical protein
MMQNDRFLASTTGQKEPMRICLAVFLALTSIQAGADSALRVRAVEIVGYGIFTARETTRDDRRNGPALKGDKVEGITFTDYTTNIPAQLGTSFGIQYLINSSPKGAAFPVTCVILFPEGGLVNPRGRVFQESSEELTTRIGRKTIYGYGFDEPWEMVAGEWVFEIWHKDTRLARKKFNVILFEPDAG